VGRQARSFGNVLSGPTLPAVEIPIACSLEPSKARSQAGEWYELLARVADGHERVSPTRLEIGLVPGTDVGPIVSLAQREAVCCPFLSFTIGIRADRLLLAVDVPDEATEFLDQVVVATDR